MLKYDSVVIKSEGNCTGTAGDHVNNKQEKGKTHLLLYLH